MCSENKQKNHLEYRYASIHVARLWYSSVCAKWEQSLFLVLPGKHNQQLSVPVNLFAENVQVALDKRFFFPKRWRGAMTLQSCAEVRDFPDVLFHSSILPCILVLPQYKTIPWLSYPQLCSHAPSLWLDLASVQSFGNHCNSLAGHKITSFPVCFLQLEHVEVAGRGIW